MKRRSLLFLLIAVSCTGCYNKQDTIKSSDQIPVLGWHGIPESETTVARYIEMRDAGFTINFSGYSNADQVVAALDTALKANMKLVVTCPELWNEPENTVRRFMNHPALAGYFLRDEPSRNVFAELGEWAKKIQTIDNKHFCYLNLFPNYANSAQLGTSTYREYVNTFMNEIPLKFYSFDHYPIKGTGDSIRFMRENWYENLEIFADEANKVGKPFWAFALATAIYFDNEKKNLYPIPTIAELRLEVFSDLAYGAQGIQYFTYWTPPCGIECFHDGPIYNGEKTEVYYSIKLVSEEIRNLSGVFLGSKVISVTHTGDTIPQGTQRLAELPEQIKVLETIGKGAVVSVLKNKQTTFLVIVNRDFQNPMKLNIQGDSKIKQVLKDGTIIPARISKLKTLDIEPGDVAIFSWEVKD